jgi:hypothetical protein
MAVRQDQAVAGDDHAGADAATAALGHALHAHDSRADPVDHAGHGA